MNLKLSIKTVLLSIVATCSISFGETYTVQKGDTIQKISQKFNVSEEEIIKANNIKDPKKLREGQKIKIPTAKADRTLHGKGRKKTSKEEIYEVKYGDTLEKIAKKYGISPKDIMEYNDMRDERIFAGDQLKIPLSTQALKKKREEEARKRIDLSRCEIYTLQRGGTLKHVSKKTGIDVKTLEKLNNINPNTWLEAGTKVCVGDKKEFREETTKQDCELFYKPKEKVSLSEVSRQFNIPKDRIKQINNLSKDYLEKGQMVCLKTPEDISGKKLVAGNKIKVLSPESETKIPEERPKEEKQPEQTAKVNLPREAKPKIEDFTPQTNGIKLGWPVRGSVVASFQNDENVRHLGVDLSSLCGEKVLAAESGKVIYAGDSIKAFGNLVVIRHDNGLTTVYGYLDKISVSEGVRVSKGEEIGRAGRLKNSDSCGIYFEVRRNVTPIDPLKVLE